MPVHKTHIRVRHKCQHSDRLRGRDIKGTNILFSTVKSKAIIFIKVEIVNQQARKKENAKEFFDLEFQERREKEEKTYAKNTFFQESNR